MVRVVMFDLGMTLIDSARRPFPYVTVALQEISQIVTADGKKLSSCLVSDYTMPDPPITAKKINAAFKEYLAILDGTGLRAFFEPVKKRVTLSTHAGVRKPARRVFETALQRLGSNAALGECLLVSEEHSHVQEVRNTLGMKTLQFHPAAGESGFDAWTKAPALITDLVRNEFVANAGNS